MHGLIKDRLEEYLRGGSQKKVPAEFEEHLRSCEGCREEMNGMLDQSQLLRSLCPPPDMEPRAGFYARVMDRIEAQQNASIWSIFLEPVFGRRLVVASVTLAVLMGSFLAFNEAGNAPVNSNAEAAMAYEDHPPGLGQDRQRDRETMLVTLATYRE